MRLFSPPRSAKRGAVSHRQPVGHHWDATGRDQRFPQVRGLPAQCSVFSVHGTVGGPTVDHAHLFVMLMVHCCGIAAAVYPGARQPNSAVTSAPRQPGRSYPQATSSVQHASGHAGGSARRSHTGGNGRGSTASSATGSAPRVGTSGYLASSPRVCKGKLGKVAPVSKGAMASNLVHVKSMCAVPDWQ